MTQALSERPGLGEGTYTFSEAAQIISGSRHHVSARSLRYWMTTGLVPPSARDTFDDDPILSFADLISLEVIRRFRSEGASLQKIRSIDAALKEHFPEFGRPFAHQVFFTDGADVWVEVGGPEDRLVIELKGRHRHHYAWRDAVTTFATEIRFDGPDNSATSWTLSPWVQVDPAVQFGQPIVTGTRVTVDTVVANLRAGTPDEVADWYGLSVQQVEGVRDYSKAQ